MCFLTSKMRGLIESKVVSTKASIMWRLKSPKIMFIWLEVAFAIVMRRNHISNHLTNSIERICIYVYELGCTFGTRSYKKQEKVKLYVTVISHVHKKLTLTCPYMYPIFEIWFFVQICVLLELKEYSRKYASFKLGSSLNISKWMQITGNALKMPNLGHLRIKADHVAWVFWFFCRSGCGP